MPRIIYECDTCENKFATAVEAYACCPAITKWYGCDECDYLYLKEHLALACDHLEEEETND